MGCGTPPRRPWFGTHPIWARSVRLPTSSATSPDMLMRTYAHAMPESVRTVTDKIEQRMNDAW